MGHYWNTFAGLITTPFEHAALVWGIVPLYFGLLLNELTADKANFRTALQTGFSFLWAGAQWLWPFFKMRKPGEPELQIGAMLPVNLLVTFLVLALGVIALVSGLRKKYPRHWRFIGHTRFANYLRDHHLPDSGALPAADMGTAGGDCPVRRAGLVDFASRLMPLRQR